MARRMCGASISAAAALNGALEKGKNTLNIALNWCGGAQYARHSEAKGFCYLNDVVLSILELLFAHKKVLFINFDGFHSIGVEEAFYTTDRVLPVSFHQFGHQVFPGTGGIDDIGEDKGKYHTINVPFAPNITEEEYLGLVTSIVPKVFEVYNPEAVVVQCGAMNIAGNSLSSLNFSSKTHTSCVKLVSDLCTATPSVASLLLLGGATTNVCNAAKCWTLDTAIVLGKDISNVLPATALQDEESGHLFQHSPFITVACDELASLWERKNIFSQKTEFSYEEILENLEKLMEVQMNENKKTKIEASVE
jgi:histone deacetylase 1/2